MPQKKPKKRGRPKKTLKDLPKGWKGNVLKNMKEGASQTEIMAELNISRDLFYRLAKEEQEFSDTIKKGKMLSEAWWLKQGRMNLENRKFSPVLWYMNMKNRFGWKDTSEEKAQQTVVNINITSDEADKAKKRIKGKKGKWNKEK